MRLSELDHVAIAVFDLSQATAAYMALGAEKVHEERVASDGVDEVLLRVADSYVQLLAPFSEDSTVARFLARRGEGLHHLGLRVPSCQAALEELRAEGFEVIDEVPRPGSRGTTVAFVHPRSAHGVLIELVEEPSQATV
jgi:methylmalonyl-CoA/ethylmalonyl-CoA epimerase